MKELKKAWKKIWWFIWKDESIWSLLVNIVLAFILIKFFIYPGLGFMLGTTHPVVAVVSGSMEHDGSFDDWWGSYCKINSLTFQQGEFYEDIDISKDMFTRFPFKHGFNTGDLMVLVGTNELKKGDIVVFRPPEESEVIHRIIQIKEKDGKRQYTTKGDHNCGSSSSEQEISEDDIIGEAVLRVPFLGLLKLGFIKLLQLLGIS